MMLANRAEIDRIEAATESEVKPGPLDLDRVKRYLRMRRLREQLLPGSIFGEPAWDMMLDLFVAKVEGRKVATNSACIASAVPVTTALRWIERLDCAGLVERFPDGMDRRRVYVELTDAATQAMAQWVRIALVNHGI